MMDMSHPPIEHNPHVWQDLAPGYRVGVNEEGNPVTEHVIPSPVVEPAAEADEGSEQPSPTPSTQETVEPAGTDSSDSSSPAAKSDSSGAKPRRKAARNAGENSAPEAKTDSSSAGSTDGAGTAQ